MKILILSHNEICYNPRLLKAADYLHNQGHEVTVFNPIAGITSEEIYKSTIEKRDWKLIEYDISKRTAKSRINWLICSLINLFSKISFNYFNLKIGHRYYLNKGLWGLKDHQFSQYDYVIIHLIDSLPFAAKLKECYGTKIIYDSQEYFRGQYSNAPNKIKMWVYEMEKLHIHKVDILIATTNAMLKRIKSDYDIAIPSYRVRNIPTKSPICFLQVNTTQEKPISIIWHGMTIFFNNRRGLTLILEALSLLNEIEFQFFIQGNINQEQTTLFNQLTEKLNLKYKVHIIPSAHPDKIVESLIRYDIGISAEIPEEDNQRLTSSNKLFDYIHAGLAVVCPDVEGLIETIEEYKCGILFKQGDKYDLAEKLKHLMTNKDALNDLKHKSTEASNVGLFWEDDYQFVDQEISKKS